MDSEARAPRRTTISSPPKSILKSPGDSPPRTKRAAVGSGAGSSSTVIPVALDVGSPQEPRRGGAPAATGIPPEDCDVKQLRLFVLSQFASVARNVQDLENQLVAQTDTHDKAIDEIRAQIAPFESLQRDINVFAKIKDFITTDEAERKVAKVQEAVDQLIAQVNGFTDQLGGYLVGQEKLKATFDDHVELNFKVLEAECNRIKAAVDYVNEAAPGSQSSTQGEIIMHLGHAREQARHAE